MKNILFVVTSHAKLGNTNEKTGYYLSEVTHPYFQLFSNDTIIEIASPKGGKAPMDPKSNDSHDPMNKNFVEDFAHSSKLENTRPLAQIDPKQYQAVFFAGGHGVMWDFYPNPEIGRIAAKIYENGGIVAAVCHGPAALLNIKLSDGNYLVKDKKVTGFSNAEEKAIHITVPFLLETELQQRGAKYECGGLWQKKVVVSDRLITGQNPASASGVGEALMQALNRL